MKQSIIVVMVILLACGVEAAELTEGKTYRLESTKTDLKTNLSSSTTYTAARLSKFIVSDSTGTAHYVIRFKTVNDFKNRNGVKVTSTVEEDVLYILPKKIVAIGGDKDMEISKDVTETISGPVSGPLIVPFKYRLNNRSLSGDATIGYYAGYSVTSTMGEVPIPFTPIVSAGISQISVADGAETKSKSAFTWTVGLLIQNWGDMNIGLIYGQDRIGDQTWENEGKGWFSVMVGWKFN